MKVINTIGNCKEGVTKIINSIKENFRIVKSLLPSSPIFKVMI